MELKDVFDRTAFHHAYILYADRKQSIPVIKDSIARSFFDSDLTHPDFAHISYEVCKIDDIREIGERAGLRSITDRPKVFLCDCRIMTMEAQNAFLKIFEDGTSNTHFFIVTSSKGWVLPTLASRAEVYDFLDVVSFSPLTESFFKGGLRERLALIEKISKDKDRTAAVSIIEEGVSYAYMHGGHKKYTYAETVLGVYDYAMAPSSSYKMLLEYIALMIPAL